jgi:3-oxoacyl-[acyl-carrier protein] reductase
MTRRIAVTGGAGGIGRALVAALHGNGDRVAVLDLPGALRGEHDVLELACDATDEAQVSSAFATLRDAWGALDGLVTLAGFAGPRLPVAETTFAQWAEVAEGNLHATFLACRAALPLLRAGNAPAIVTMASGLATKAAPGYAPYAAAKAGVLALTRALAAENAPWLRVNAVAPSAVETDFLTRGGARFDVEAYARAVPLGRLATPEDVVGPVLFLLGDGAAYVTGQTLHVNGGLMM